MPVDVTCPGCQSKMKAPSGMQGKKVRCKKCSTPFRIPGTSKPGDSAGEPEALSTLDVPSALPVSEDDIPMAAAAEPPPDVAALPSADPFDFSAPQAPPPKPAPASPSPAAEAPRRTAFGAAKGDATAAVSAKAPAEKPAPAARKSEPAPAAKKSAPKPAPEPAPLSLDDDEPVVEAEEDVVTAEPLDEGNDLFAFGDNSEPPAPAAPPKKRGRAAKDDDEDEDEEETPKAKRKAKEKATDPEDTGYRFEGKEGRASVKPLLFAVLLAVGAVGVGVLAVIMTNKWEAEAEALRQAQEKERQEALARAAEEETIDPGENDPNDPPPPPPKKEYPKLPMFGLPDDAATFGFTPIIGDIKVAHAAVEPPIVLNMSPDKVKRVIPLTTAGAGDVVVVWQTDPGKAGGKGEKLAAEFITGDGKRSGVKIEFEGNGDSPRCDASPDGTRFLAVNPDDTITVWTLVDDGDKKPGEKLLDAHRPYADYTGGDRHQEHGIAAAYFTAHMDEETGTPTRFLTVTTGGVPHIHDMKEKKIVAASGPLGTAVPERVIQGKNVAMDAARESVIVAVNGGVLQYDANSLGTITTIELKRDDEYAEVSRPLAIAVQGNPGQIAYAFEVNLTARRLGLMLAFGNAPTYFRWPEEVGEPLGAAWAGPKIVLIWTKKGVVYIHADDGMQALKPFAFGELTTENSPHAANEFGQWYMTADPTKPGESVLVRLPSEALTEFQASIMEDKKPIVKLSEKGLSK